MRRRSSMSPRFFISAGRVGEHHAAPASTAWLSDTGLALMFQIDSSACDSASRPAARVGPAGSESVSSGSTQRRLGPGLGQVQRVLLAGGAVPDRRPAGDLAAGARGRGHGDQRLDAMRRERLAGGEQRHQGVELAALGADHQRLGGVEGAAAADRDDHLALAVLAPEGAVEGVEAVDVGVRLGLVDHADERRRRAAFPAAAAGRSRVASGKVTMLALRPRSTARQGVEDAGAEVHRDRVVILPMGSWRIPWRRGRSGGVVQREIEDVEVAQPPRRIDIDSAAG